MRQLASLGAALILLLAGCAGARAAVRYQAGDGSPPAESLWWGFDADPTDAISMVGPIFSGTWEVRSEGDAPSQPNALCQTGSAQYPALSLGDRVFSDVALTARFKPISGREDQAGGVLLRVRDAKNYYIVRANALEGNVVIFKYVDGRRSEIKSGAATVPSGTWQLLRAEAIGTRIRGYLGGTLVVEGEDSTFGDGGAGLWTKADSVSCFDDVVLGPVGG